MFICPSLRLSFPPSFSSPPLISLLPLFFFFFPELPSPPYPLPLFCPPTGNSFPSYSFYLLLTFFFPLFDLDRDTFPVFAFSLRFFFFPLLPSFLYEFTFSPLFPLFSPLHAFSPPRFSPSIVLFRQSSFLYDPYFFFFFLHPFTLTDFPLPSFGTLPSVPLRPTHFAIFLFSVCRRLFSTCFSYRTYRSIDFSPFYSRQFSSRASFSCPSSVLLVLTFTAPFNPTPLFCPPPHLSSPFPRYFPFSLLPFVPPFLFSFFDSNRINLSPPTPPLCPQE